MEGLESEDRDGRAYVCGIWLMKNVNKYWQTEIWLRESISMWKAGNIQIRRRHHQLTRKSTEIVVRLYYAMTDEDGMFLKDI